MIVLSVDDVQLIRKMIRGTVEALGGSLLEASNGMEGLEVLEKNAGNIDLILLDWNMPKMNGFEFLCSVKSNNRFKHIPVIMSTTESEKDKIIKAIQAGASNYLVKPFTEQELAKKIMDCLGLVYERINKCFSVALRNIISTATALEVLEDIGGSEEKLTQKGLFFGQILLCGQINAVVFFTMNQETAAKIVGKSPSEPANEELVDGIAEMASNVAAKVKTLLAEANITLNLSTPFVFAGFADESRHVLHKKKVYTVSRRYHAGDIEVTFKIYYF